MTPEVRLTDALLERDGRPFLVVGAELHNSSSSSVSAITRSLRAMREIGANTVLAPVAWDLFEPQEGVYDFTLVDALIATAAAEGLAVIPLWFGSWKNGMSSYAPSWVKRDTARFPRAELRHAGPVEVLSPFGAESRAADAAAFRALLGRIRDVDTERVVLMVQVENEVGILGDARDRSPLAEQAWAQQVPDAVIAAISGSGAGRLHEAWLAAGSPTGGTWESVLGSAADEGFMAAAFATYIEAVAAAGRAEWDLPLFANAWLDTPVELDLPDMPAWAEMAGGESAGFYPSGGPLSHLAPIWRALAPSLDFLAPDIYFGDFDELCRRYSDASGGRLFIPEMRRSPRGVGHMFLALGEHRALGVAPFGVDSLLPGAAGYDDLSDGYRLLRAFASVRKRVPSGSSRGFLLSAEQPSARFEFDGVTLQIDSADPSGLFPPVYPAYGALVETGHDEFVVIGRGFSVTFAPTDGSRVGILGATELAGPEAEEVVRRLGGDETGSGQMVRFPALTAATPAVFPIPFDMRSTGIVEIQLYRYL
ncbi:hypothetical protein FB565_003057 [Actinoplanes lutulentus]|uniref:Beta-galactosidase-like protein n=1 Tax=Actinoplanes lutulentus TaxID=1287878 RepID=A0A327Z323_9ACTN|nr:DUF5597 domain-containing protein [Actinoplanes lutulentus]MBB2943344.1 hypothetical protein [Actinoplanes lutulentus]RAK28403.1 beta-galactosidase-like protein [Actinoplanes lutulentus]